VLYFHGLPLVNFQSREMQFRRGENLNGFEIKFDGRFADTRRLFIPTAEKSHPSNAALVPSGIYRNDASWMWVVGDRSVLFIIARNYLVRLHRSGRYEERATETSAGFLLPEAHARIAAAKTIEI
jgi:hypothetical protein